MKNGQAALAFTGAYFLGRFHKMRWALTLAGVTVGKRLRSGGGASGAASQLLKSPEVNRLAQQTRHQLAAAGKTAAVAAASNRMDSLSDRLERRASALRSGHPDGEQEAEERQEPRSDRAQEPEKSQPRQGERPERTEPHRRERTRDTGEHQGRGTKRPAASESKERREGAEDEEARAARRAAKKRAAMTGDRVPRKTAGPGTREEAQRSTARKIPARGATQQSRG